MKNLIPRFILEKYEDKKISGNFKATTIFIDISGFTAMTQDLMKNGKEGSEILSEIINNIFTPAIELIYKNNGFISTFAGDAFTAIFTYKDSKPLFAANAALQIQHIFNKIGKQKTKFGDFDLSVKIGISYGKVSWGILNGRSLSSYFFRGDAIDNCTKCEKNTKRGEILFDSEFKSKLKSAKSIKKGDNLYGLIELNIKSKIAPKVLKTTNISSKAFILPSISKLRSKGEFRNIISCFISFEDGKNWKRAISQLLDLSQTYGGYFNKIDFGDKGGNVLVLFGAPIGKEKIYSRACRFALAARNIHNFDMRIGLTFGSVFAGFIGSELRAEYSALGMVVNLSARFMMKAKANEIYIDQEIRKNIENKYVTNTLGKLNFKGFSKAIPVFLLENQKQIKVFKTKNIVGRKAELQKLFDAIEPIQKGEFGGIVYVQGMAGIGKSRLVSELKSTLILDDTKKYNWFYLPCDEILRKSFNPFIHFFKEYFMQSEENTKKTNLFNFESKLKKLIDKTKDVDIKNELIRTKSILGAMLDLDWKNSEYKQLDAKGRFENTLYAVKNLIKAESLQKPVIIELEDGHWIDSDSKKLLKTLTINIENYPIIIISACRLNDDNSLFNFGFKEVPQKNIILEHLERKSCCKLAEDKLQGKASEEIFDLIWAKSEGNPFYIEQIVLYLQENNLIDKNLRLTDRKFEIPQTINSIIIARIDRLTTELKEVVQTASVLGREFAASILSAMINKTAISKELVEGENENIWEALTKINYIFKHALIRETVYEMQLKKKLRNLHKLAGETIESIFKDEIKSHYSDLANHFEKAEITEKAIEYLKKAGDFAKDNYQNTKAIDFYSRLLKQLKQKNSELKIEILLKRGEILQLIGRWKDAKSDFEKAKDLSQALKDKELETKSVSALGKQYYLQADYDNAVACFDKLLEIGNSLNDKKTIAFVASKMGAVFSSTGKIKKSMEFYQKGLKIFREIDYKPGISVTIGNIGLVYSLLGNYDKAMECYKEYMQTAEELGRSSSVAVALGNMSTIYRIYGDYEKGRQCINKSLEISRKRGDKRTIASLLMLLGGIYMRQNNLIESQKIVMKALDIYKEIGDKKGALVSIVNIGVIYATKGDYEKAMTYYKKYLALSKELNDKDAEITALRNIGMIYKVKGDYFKALNYFNENLKICKKNGNISKESAILQLIGNIFQSQRDFPKALDSYNKAIETIKEIKSSPELAKALFFKAETLYQMGKYREARNSNDESYEMILKSKQYNQISFCKVLKEKINFKLGNDENASIKRLKTLLNKEKDNKMEAHINYELAFMYHELKEIKLAKKHKDESIKQYKEVYKKAPDVKFKNVIDELNNIIK